jgi:hypothetical protein
MGEAAGHIPVDVLVNSKGDVMVAYADPALDDTRTLLVSRTGALSAVLPGGMVFDRTVSLGRLKDRSVLAALLASADALFTRAGDGGLVGGVVSVEVVT